MSALTVRYWAAAKTAAGVAEEDVDVPDAGTTLGDVLELVSARHGGELPTVLRRCSFLLDGVRCDRATPVRAGSVVEVLPPFAGG
ncbi:MAG: MoaD/ThiS family protein [Actinomycetota bacterium]|nr:MoaD/ThiS family protein [Actinomycetota bacterium]